MIALSPPQPMKLLSWLAKTALCFFLPFISF